VVAVLRDSAVHMGHDEYGAFLGVVTSADILESIVGGFLVRSRICRGCG